VIAIREADRLVLIDGYLRVEALRKLGRDTAHATTWPLSEVEALLHHRHLSLAGRAAIEDAWLLAGYASMGCRSTSWRVRIGTVPPHAAMKYLVPLARANRSQCEQLVTGLSDTRVSVRELGALYDAWRRADRAGKQRIVAEPLLCLRALSQTRAPDADAITLRHVKRAWSSNRSGTLPSVALGIWPLT
jgi:ParB family chromosome partitioning protein